MKLKILDGNRIRMFAGYIPERFLTGQDRLYLGAASDGGICAAAVFTMGTESFLDYIYVTEDKRREGIGSFLLNEFFRIAGEMGVKSLAASFYGNEEAVSFLEKNGFFVGRGSQMYSITLADAKASDKFVGLMKRRYDYDIRSFEKLSHVERKTVKRYLASVDSQIDRVCGNDFSPRLSAVVLGKNNIPGSFILCSEHENGVSVDMIVGTKAMELSILCLFKHLYNELNKDGRDDTEISFIAVNPGVGSMTKTLFGERLRNIGCSITAVSAVSGR